MEENQREGERKRMGEQELGVLDISCSLVSGSHGRYEVPGQSTLQGQPMPCARNCQGRYKEDLGDSVGSPRRQARVLKEGGLE